MSNSPTTSYSIRIDTVNVHLPPASTDLFQAALQSILERLSTMSIPLDNLKREVTETRTVVDSAITLINGLSERLKAAIGDDAALEALAADLDAQQLALAAAITANTPAAPVTPVDPAAPTA